MRQVIAVLLCLALVCSPVTGQGNRRSSPTVLGSTSTFLQLQALYRNSRQWNQAYTASPKSACSKSSKSSSKAANLCAGSTNSKEALTQYYQLLLSTSPRVYSSSNTQQTGGLQLVSPPGNQAPCQTCTAFAVAAAAEAAMATALGVDVSQCSISAKALHYCAISRTCNSGWTLPAALEELQQRGSSLPTSACLSDGFREQDAASSTDLCGRSNKCRTTNPFARQGSFSAQRVSTPWEAQRHIRQHGAVVTHFELYADFDAFFRNPNNAKAVYRPPPGAVPQENHAVLLVGYDNDRQFWLARNSWGVDWGDSGLFRVAFDTCGVLTPGSEAYGVVWAPKAVSDAVKLPVTPGAPQHPGCYWYQARPGDWLSRVAWLAGIPLEQFMLDNTAVVKELDAPISGLQLLLCKPNPDMIIDATKPVDKQLQSLLKIKAFIDTAGVLKEWNEQDGADGGYCKWRGIDCIEGGNVVERVNLWSGTSVSGLQGVLPPASAFDGLPGLRRLSIGNQPGISGTLPPDWSRLQQLQDIRVRNKSLTGTLPPSWGQMRALKILYLHNNTLRGRLPDAWSGMAAMEDLHTNALTGSLPPSWGQLRRLRRFLAYRNKLQGPLPDSFKALTSLEYLGLHYNSLSGSLPPSWDEMRALKTLSLTRNKLQGPLPDSWSSMAALEKLYLGSNVLTGSLSPLWGQMSRLRVFSAYLNKLQGPLPDAWSGMVALEKLSLYRNALTGSLSPTWGQLRRLQELRADNNRLQGPLPDEFKDLEALTILKLSANFLTGLLPPSWGQLKNLKELTLSANKLRGRLPDAYKSLTQLERLSLSRNDFSGVVPPSWQSMTRLKEVYLYNNPRLRGCLAHIWKQQLLQKWMF